MKKIFLLLYVVAISVWGQTLYSDADSLNLIIQNCSGIEKVDLLVNLSYNHKEISISKRIDYAKEAREIADKLNYKDGVAWAINREALCILKTGRKNEALDSANIALALFEDINNLDGVASTHTLIGLINYRYNNYSSALEHYFEGLRLFEKIGNKEHILICLSNIGLVYRDMNNSQKALEYYLRLLELKRETGNKKSIAISLNNIGILYQKENDNVKALEYLFESLKIREELREKKSLAIAYNNIGNSFDAMGEYKKALEFFNKSLAIKIKLGYEKGEAISLNNLGKVYENMKDYINALKYYRQSLSLKSELNDIEGMIITSNNIGNLYSKQTKIKQAANYFNQSLQFAKSINDNKSLRDTYKYLADLYSIINNYRSANECFLLYEKHKDLYYHEENDKKIAEVHAVNQLKKKEKENLLLKKDNEIFLLEIEKQTNLRNFFIAVSIIVLFVIGFIFFRYEVNRRANKAQQKLLNKLDAANKTKDKFFSIIAHDLRSPFNSLIGFSELIIQDYEEMNKNAIVDYVNEIHKTSNDTLKLLDDLLTWARAQGSNIAIRKSKQNLFDLINAALIPYKINAVNKKIDIHINVEQNQYCICDKETIAITIANLFANAVKFTSENGRINIFTKKEDGYFEIHVSDNGVGISEENIELIFKLDGNLSTLGTNDEKGTGLGLLICKEFVEKNGGVINVKSEPGKGSDFCFTVPEA